MSGIIGGAGSKSGVIIYDNNRPAFNVHRTASWTISASSTTIVPFNSATNFFDTDGCYDTSTYTFTPAREGLYFISMRINIDNLDDGANLEAIIYLNGGLYMNERCSSGALAGHQTQQVQAMISLDEDDYVQAYIWHNDDGDVFMADSRYNQFCGFRVSSRY
tara:strand:+ start:388 stop:873 length:486 start_codon:yes stop_codon:yes gene_type:complete